MRTDFGGAIVLDAAMNDTSDIPAKLKALREQSGLSIRRVADELGMQSSGYSHYELRYKRPFLPMEFAQSLAKVLGRHGVDPHEVLSLAGVSEAPDRADMALVISDNDTLVPVYNVAASAGHGALIDWEEAVVERLAFPPDYLRKVTSSHPRNLAIIGVKGDSMVPTLADNDVVMIDTSKTDTSFDGLFVFRDGGASVLVKRFGRGSKSGTVMVISDNRTYPPIERDVNDIQVIGKVVWRGVKE